MNNGSSHDLIYLPSVGVDAVPELAAGAVQAVYPVGSLFGFTQVVQVDILTVVVRINRRGSGEIEYVIHHNRDIIAVAPYISRLIGDIPLRKF